MFIYFLILFYQHVSFLHWTCQAQPSSSSSIWEDSLTHQTRDKQFNNKCTLLENSFCGSSWTTLSVQSKFFPNSSVFDTTVAKFATGQDSQSTLLSFVGCSWDPSLRARYAFTFFCHYLPFDSKAKGDCSTATRSFSTLSRASNDSMDLPVLCQSTCKAWLTSLNSVFNDPSLCPLNDTSKVANRNILLAHWQKHCFGSTHVADGPHCIPFIEKEKSFCGFGNMGAAVKYCSSNSASKGKDDCCSDPSIQKGSPSSSSKSKNDSKSSLEEDQDSSCKFTDITCMDVIKLSLLILILCILLVALIFLWSHWLTKKNEEKQQQHRQKQQAQQKKQAKKDLAISNPIKSEDNDYTALLKGFPTLKPLPAAVTSSDSTPSKGFHAPSMSFDPSDDVLQDFLNQSQKGSPPPCPPPPVTDLFHFLHRTSSSDMTTKVEGSDNNRSPNQNLTLTGTAPSTTQHQQQQNAAQDFQDFLEQSFQLTTPIHPSSSSSSSSSLHGESSNTPFSPSQNYETPLDRGRTGAKSMSFTVYKAMFDYSPATAKDGSLEVLKDDQLAVKQVLDNGLALCVVLKTGQEGLLPFSPLEAHHHHHPS